MGNSHSFCLRHTHIPTKSSTTHVHILRRTTLTVTNLGEQYKDARALETIPRVQSSITAYPPVPCRVHPLQDGKSPVVYAVSEGNTEALAELIAGNADLDIRDKVTGDDKWGG